MDLTLHVIQNVLKQDSLSCRVIVCEDQYFQIQINTLRTGDADLRI